MRDEPLSAHPVRSQYANVCGSCEAARKKYRYPMSDEASNGAHMEEELKEIRCIASGRVQGVMYRDFVARHARRLALTGYVRNLPDFTVEIVAQGYADSLEKFLEYARRGPFLARVAKLAVEHRDASEQLAFEVVF